MGNKRNRKRKSDRKRDDDANMEKKLKNRAKRARVAETEERIEYIRTDLHDTIDEIVTSVNPMIRKNTHIFFLSLIIIWEIKIL